METRASYVVVGTFVLALTAAAFGVVIFLTRTTFEDAPVRFAIAASPSGRSTISV